MSDGATRRQRRVELRALNSRAWDGEQVFVPPESYDTSLKKNTAFINRCKVNLQEGSQTILLREVGTLSLQKYFPEILSALWNGLTKCRSSSELFVGVEVCSALHQRFVLTFSTELMALFLQGIQNPSRGQLDLLSFEARHREDRTRHERHLAVLKVLIELYLVDIFRSINDVTAEGLAVPRWVTKSNTSNPVLGSLNEVLNYDLNTFSAGPIAVNIFKKYGSILTGTTSIKILSPDTCRLFEDLFKTYTEAMIAELRLLGGQARSLERRINATTLRRGKPKEEIVVKRQAVVALFTEIKEYCSQLCELLDMELPDYKLGSEAESGALISIGTSTVGESGLWDDDEQRKFYEDLVVLSPETESDTSEVDEDELEEQEFAEEDKMFEELEKLQERESHDVGEVDEDDGRVKSKQKPVQEEQADNSKVKPKEKDNEKDNEKDMEKDKEKETTPGLRMKEILHSLSVTSSKDGVDSLATRFAELNSPLARRMLISAFTNIPIHEQHQLPFYCRFLASVNPIAPEVAKKVVEDLSSYFLWLQKKRKVNAVGSRRLFNIRYFAELAKFGLMTKFEVFHKLKTMIERLDTKNIENIFVLFEACGRYLMRKPQFHELMVKCLEVLDATKNKAKLTADDKAMIKAAVTYVTPPSRGGAVVPAKQRSIAEQYVRHLIYHELADNSDNELVLSQLRRLDWSDADTCQSVIKVFTKVWKARYAHVPVLAHFVAKLSVYHRHFRVKVLDGLLESIRRGLETNHFEQSQQRITQVKYLAALAKEQVVSPVIIFDVLFQILMYGHANGGYPQRGEFCPLDPADDFFRIRLVCSIMEADGIVALLQNRHAKRFAMLVAFLQYYIVTKDRLSMDVDFQVQDTLHLIDPNLKLFMNPEAASQNLKRAIDRFNGRAVSSEEITDESFETAQAAKKAQEIDSTPESERERLARERRQAERDRLRAQRADSKATNQFEQDLRRIIMDTSRPGLERRRDAFDEPVPSVAGPNTSQTEPTTNGAVKYMVMTRKNNRSQIQALSIPSSVNFVRTVEEEKRRIYNEKERVREYVLRYSYQNEQEDRTIEKVVQPLLPSTRYSRLKFKRPSASSASTRQNDDAGEPM